MATKLYPPYIEGTLPAFIYSDTKVTIKVPYVLNRASGAVSKMSIKVKTIYSNAYIAQTITTKIDKENNIATFEFEYNDADKNPFSIGQSYKIQIACVDGNNIEGYYSTVGVAKCTAEPKISIDHKSVIHSYTYVGTYVNNNDPTEHEYSYNFSMYDENGDLVATSGDLLHNAEEDINPANSRDTYTFNRDIPEGKVYTLTYSVTTMNNYQASTTISIQQAIEVDYIDGWNLVAENDFDNGRIFVSLEKNEESAAALNGRFILVRRRADTEYVWDTLSNLHIINDNKGGLIYTDFTAEQGVEYIYAIYRENSHYIRTHKLVAEPIVADFEDMFLYDGERQLKIRFNPQVSSFKTNILESKSETIGSKYPFFFRNGRVAYKEFPINGLISYFMDEKELFLTDSDMGLEPDLSERLRTAANDYTEKHLRTVQQVGYNFAAERIFKLSVLDWLNDGKPKLFRSPAEGNYLVRLMGVSLSPEQSISRLVHNFSATAYEIGDTSYATLTSNEVSILKVNNIEISDLTIETIQLTPDNINTNLFKNKLVYGFYLDTYTPVTATLIRDDGDLLTFQTIGDIFEIQPSDGFKFTSLIINGALFEHGTLTYMYSATESYDDFDKIKEINISKHIANANLTDTDANTTRIINQIIIKSTEPTDPVDEQTLFGETVTISDGMVLSGSWELNETDEIIVPDKYRYYITYTDYTKVLEEG